MPKKINHPLSHEDEKRIKNNFGFLKQELVQEEIRDHFLDEGLWDIQDLDDIDAEKTPTKKNEKFLRLLLQSGPSAYGLFIEALKKKQSFHIVDRLQQTETVKGLDILQKTPIIQGSPEQSTSVSSYENPKVEGLAIGSMIAGRQSEAGFETDPAPERECYRKTLYYKATSFPHFEYIHKLTKNCISRAEKMMKEGIDKPKDMLDDMLEDITFEITYIGELTDENLKVVAGEYGMEKLPKKKIWNINSKLIVCFQNSSSLDPILKIFDAYPDKAHQKILVANSKCELPKYDNLVIVDNDEIREKITSCLEKPLRVLLDQCMQELKPATPSKAKQRILREINSIKEMSLEKPKEAKGGSSPDSKSFGCANLIPSEVKDYLISKHVNCFGIWYPDTLKIYVDKNTDKVKMREELIAIGAGLDFFDKYKPVIRFGKPVKTESLKQGDYISNDTPPAAGNYPAGTLGGFVVDTEDPTKIYALTCHHIFHREEPTAYWPQFPDPKIIGTCVYRINGDSDFAAIEINEDTISECDVYFRKDLETQTNAQLFTGNVRDLELSIVHKIGAVSHFKSGIALSPEIYLSEIQREDLLPQYQMGFVVEGLEDYFSLRGDSGSLVFAQENNDELTNVNVVGMITSLIVFDSDDPDDETHEDNDEEYPDTWCSLIRPSLNAFNTDNNLNTTFKRLPQT